MASKEIRKVLGRGWTSPASFRGITEKKKKKGEAQRGEKKSSKRYNV